MRDITYGNDYRTIMPQPTLNKSEIIRGLAANRKLTHKQVESLVNDFLRAIMLSLQDGTDVKLSGFGIFECRDRKPVTRKNPKTGDPIFVDAKVTVGFKPSPVLKTKVNNGHG